MERSTVGPPSSEVEAGERWLPIPGWEGFYSVSDHGRLYSEIRVVFTKLGTQKRVGGHILRATPDSEGRGKARLQDRSTGRMVSVYNYIAVLTAFKGSRPLGFDGRHLDGDPSNNHLSNLDWGTRLENVHDMLRHGTKAQQRRDTCPRNHPLAVPNLVSGDPSKGRSCLACARARGYLSKAEPGYSLARLQEESDRQYAAILEAPGRRVTRKLGETHPNAVLTEELVVEIRDEAAKGVSGKRIAKRLGVSQATIQKVVSRKSWAHVA